MADSSDQKKVIYEPMEEAIYDNSSEERNEAIAYFEREEPGYNIFKNYPGYDLDQEVRVMKGEVMRHVSERRKVISYTTLAMYRSV